jgi:hypothetical protein
MPNFTSPDNIQYPVGTDPVAPLANVFQDLATTTQTAVTAVNTRVTNLDNKLDNTDLDDLDDVNITSPLYGQVISYDPSTTGFINNDDVSAVMAFADATARDAAITTPVEGNIVYMKDTDDVLKWTGASWEPVGTGGVISSKTAFLTGTRTQSINSGTYYTIPETQISHAVAKLGNSVILWGQLQGCYPGTGLADSLMAGALTQGGSPINIGNAAGNRTRVSQYNIGPYSDTHFSTSSVFMVARFTPATTNAITYGVAVASTSSGTWYINRSLEDADNAIRTRGASGLILMEVEA